MSKWHIIIVIVLGLCFPGLAFSEKSPTGRLDGIINLVIHNVESTEPLVNYLAQKEEKKTLDDATVDKTVKADKDAMKPEPASKDKSATKKSKQLKPFIPSEKVPADQEVDFPYDI